MKTKSSLKIYFLAISSLALITCSNDARRFGYENLVYQNQGLLDYKDTLYDDRHYQKPYFESAPQEKDSYQRITFTNRNIQEEIEYNLQQKSNNNLTTASLKAKQYQTSKDANKYIIIVQDGDTLYSIAKNNGYTIQALAEENNIQTPYKINVGQELFLAKKINQPNYSAGNQISGRPSFHKVAEGENLFQISVRYNIKLSRLAEYNQIGNTSSIYVGQKINIPSTQDYQTYYQPQKQPKTFLTKKPTTLISKKSYRKKTELKNNKMRWPVSGRIIKPFSLDEKNKNEGINILAPYGTGVRAANDGEVVYADDKLRGYGKLILIRHDNQIVTAYAYNSKLLVEKEDKVKRGQIIAHIGSSGAVNRPQLHFEVRKGSLAVNPLLYLAKK